MQLTNYQSFLQDILAKIQQARYEMLKSVSKQTVLLYFEIGKSVSKKVKSEGWGKSIVEQLSKDLQTEFPGVRGFSARNIWRMKIFYEFYAEYKKLPPVVAEIGWVQNYIILEKCKDEKQREFYLKKSKEKGWSKLDLLENIKNNYFENQLIAQNNFEKTVSAELKAQVAWEFMDDYNIEIINPDQPISEKKLENSIVSNIVKFLQDMGGSFAFVGRQYRLTIDKKEYFIDLLFFNFKLNCYVVFEIKAREFDPKDVGQVQMYMQLVNKHVKQTSHNPTIGVIICREKNRTVVEYMLEQVSQPLGVATYNRYDELPKQYAKYLPSEEKIIRRLASINDSKI
jgi:predicted nuclease of restriction endonuclease-like (RecB) superfamily